MPLLPPVITAILPSSLPILFFSSVARIPDASEFLPSRGDRAPISLAGFSGCRRKCRAFLQLARKSRRRPGKRRRGRYLPAGRRGPAELALQTVYENRLRGSPRFAHPQ